MRKTHRRFRWCANIDCNGLTKVCHSTEGIFGCVGWMQWFKEQFSLEIVNVQLCIPRNADCFDILYRWLSSMNYRWLSWKERGIPIWFESTLLPQTEIFTVLMNLRKKIVFTLYWFTCALSAVNRVHMERAEHWGLSPCLGMLGFNVSACRAIDSFRKSALQLIKAHVCVTLNGSARHQ